MMDIKSKFLDEILNCLNVEWKPLGKVLVRTKGTQITAAKMKELHKDNAPLKIFAGGKTVAYFNFEDIPEKDINREPSIIVKSRGVIEFEYYDQPFSHKNEMWSYHTQDKNVEVKYVYYFLKCNEDYFQKIGSKMQMPQISTPDTEKYLIPIPPLPIQQKIVDILDKFTELTAELTAEFTARKQQYEYYRDELLTFGDDVEWKTLDDISLKVSSGGTPLSTREDYYGGEIPWLRTQEVRFAEIFNTDIKITKLGLNESSAKWIPSNCVIVAISGATAGRSAINKIPLTTNQHCCNLEINPKYANYKYVYYWVVKEYEQLKSLGQGARCDLNSGIIKKYPIPIPSLDEQARIVEILDKFDVLTNSITEGLPREIELRQQQYEYYRDLLLSFPKHEEAK